MSVKATFLSHSGFIIEGEDHSIVIDPFLSGNPLAKTKAEAIKCDFVILTHGHGDHLGDGITIAKNNNATLIAPYELAMYCQWQGVEKVHPMHIGGSFGFPFGKVKLTLALHGSAVVDGNNIIYTGNPCGVVLTINGKSIYHAGDTGLFYDMKLIGEMSKLDVAFLPIGGNFTMDIDDAVKAAELLNPALAVPMHYNTFDVIKADPQQFVEKCKSRGINARILDIGETLEI